MTPKPIKDCCQDVDAVANTIADTVVSTATTVQNAIVSVAELNPNQYLVTPIVDFDRFQNPYSQH